MKTVTTLALALVPLAAACGGSSAPDAGKARAAIEAELAEHAGGKIELASFEKTDTQEGDLFGVQVVSIGFDAELEFLADGYWVFGGEQAGFGLSATEVWPGEPVTRGQKRAITGSVDFAKTDDGWQAKVDLDLPLPGSRAASSAAAKKAAEPSPLDLEARAFVESKLAEHWTRGPDGWTTQYRSRSMSGQILSDPPDMLFRQLRKIEFTLAPEPLTESQRLNGADYRAGVTFAGTPERFFHRVKSWDGVKGWSQWKDTHLGSIAVERRNGEWLASRDRLFDEFKPDAEIPTGM